MLLRNRLLLGISAALLLTSVALAQPRGGARITKGPVVEHADANSAVIAWSTNEPSSTVVRYGNDRDRLDQTAQLPWGGVTHRVTLKNLQPGQRYFFRVESGQAQGSGGSDVSRIDSFTTESQYGDRGREGDRGHDRDRDHDRDSRDRNSFRITNGPTIEHVSGNSAIVAWSTDRPASSIVRYGNDPNHLDQTAEQPWGATTHRVEIKNLRPNTQYFFAVHSAQGLNAPGQRAESDPIAFRTSGNYDRRDDRDRRRQ